MSMAALFLFLFFGTLAQVLGIAITKGPSAAVGYLPFVVFAP